MIVRATAVVPLDAATDRGDGPRADAWRYVSRHLQERLPIAIGLGGDPWVKARAVAYALAHEHVADVLVLHDADVLVAPEYLERAIDVVADGAPWAIPHALVRRFDERSSRAVYDGDYSRPATLTRWAYTGMAGGGIVVIGRDAYEAVPLDARFEGWGGEDQAWGFALETLLGAPLRLDGTLTHFWHPHATGLRNPQRPPRIESARLQRAYRAARGDATRMLALVESGSLHVPRGTSATS